jgi:hypothetical protein
MAQTDLTYGWAAIEKSYEMPDGSVIVEGRLGGPTEDLDGQFLDKGWLDKAVPEWMERGNIRAMHKAISAGKALAATDKGDDWHLRAKINDPVEKTKVLDGNYTGFSVGVKNGHITPTNKIAKNTGRPLEAIDGGTIVEVSLADFPCDPNNFLQVFSKSASIEGEITEDDEAWIAYKSAEADIYKRDFNTADRKRLANEGKALPDGSFPIENEEDLHNAIRLVGHAKDPAKAKAHIKARATAMGMTGALPDDWKDAEPEIKKDAEPVLGVAELLEKLASGTANEAEMALLKAVAAAVEKTSGAYDGAAEPQQLDALDDKDDDTCAACAKAGCDSCGTCDTKECANRKVSDDVNADNSDDHLMGSDNVRGVGDMDSDDGMPNVPELKMNVPEVTKLVSAEVAKAVTPDLMKAVVSEAVAAAIRPLEEKIAAMEKMAAPGGPMIGSMRQTFGTKASGRDLLQKRANELTPLLEHPDFQVRAGARELLEKLASID